MTQSSVILSEVMIREYMDLRDAAELISKAAGKTIRNKMVTIDFYNLMKKAPYLKQVSLRMQLSRICNVYRFRYICV